MHRTFLSSTGCALLLATSVISAQSAAPAKTEASGKEVTVTGCLSQGTEPGHYMLMKASASGAGAASEATGTAGTASSTAPAPTVTYELMGGGDLKAHLGHKVEVVGTAAAPDMHKDTATSKEPAPRSAMGRGGSEIYGAMNVTTVKMIASSCS